MQELIIKPSHCGLGDHLFFTPIPRIAKKFGYQKVFISTEAVFRKPIYRHYIWECNPYVDGFKAAPATFNVQCQTGYHEPFIRKGNVIDRILKEHGLDDKQLWHKPEVYFETKSYEQFKNAAILDPCFISLNNIDLGRYKEKIGKWLQKNRVKIDYQIITSLANNLYLQGIGERLECNDFIEYCSIVKSCRNFFCLYSGSLVLAEALDKHPTVLYCGLHRRRTLSFQLKRFKNLGRGFLKNRDISMFADKLTKGIHSEIYEEILRHKTNPRIFLESNFIKL